MSKLNITFFGLGNMGFGMASNLLKAGYNLTVYDLVQEQVEKMQKLGALTASSPIDAISNADAVISMLPAGNHVQGLYEQIMPKLKQNTLLIDCSTIESSLAKNLNNQASKHALRFVDAPVSGGVAGANAGTLTFIMGGNAEDVSAAQTILSKIGKHTFHAGDAGAGQIAKICNNMLLAVLMVGTSEALKMALDNGLKAETISEIMKQSSGNNWVLQNYNPVPDVMPNVPSSNDYKGGFLVDLMNKDLNLAMDTAAQKQSIVPLGSLAKSLYQLHKQRGHGQEDFSSIFKSFLGDDLI